VAEIKFIVDQPIWKFSYLSIFQLHLLFCFYQNQIILIDRHTNSRKYIL
jgi:hypothetical protein